MSTTYRQGDVFILKLDDDEQVDTYEEVERDQGSVILAYGEVTGHAHRIKSKKAKLYSKNDRRVLQTLKEVALTHEEHDTIEIPPGLYEIRIQREYTPERIRNVAD